MDNWIVRGLLLTGIVIGFILGFLAKANATVIHSDHPEPFQTWADESQVPGPAEATVEFGTPDRVYIDIPFHPTTIVWYDYYPGSVAESWRPLFLHELGHIFDFTLMGNTAHFRYLKIYRPHLKRKGLWYTKYNDEQWADDYAACAIGQLTMGPLGYSFRPPTLRQHYRICNLIQRIGTRYGPVN